MAANREVRGGREAGGRLLLLLRLSPLSFHRTLSAPSPSLLHRSQRGGRAKVRARSGGRGGMEERPEARGASSTAHDAVPQHWSVSGQRPRRREDETCRVPCEGRGPYLTCQSSPILFPLLLNTPSPGLPLPLPFPQFPPLSVCLSVSLSLSLSHFLFPVSLFPPPPLPLPSLPPALRPRPRGRARGGAAARPRLPGETISFLLLDHVFLSCGWRRGRAMQIPTTGRGG